jgi:proteasome lid subunit RPN8/RPN11
MKLVLPSMLRTQVVEAAGAGFPRECCGLIEGEWQGATALAMALHPARNSDERNDRFAIHPEDHFAALRQARAHGRALIGCYHSHPNGSPSPSATDRDGAGEENFLWLIAALSAADGPVTVEAFVYSAAGFFSIGLTEAVGADLVTSSE